MGQVCQRRKPAEVDVAKQPLKAKAAAKPAGAAASSAAPAAGAAGDSPAPKANPAKYSIDYSRFANLEDSDDDKPQEKKDEYDEVDRRPPLPRDAAPMWNGKPLPTEEQRLLFTDELMELCRKANQEHKQIFDGNDGPKNVKLPPDYKKPLGIIDVKTLGKYTCSADRMLLSVYGDIFDVSSRPDIYGYGSKSFLTGKDITWGVIAGKETADNCNRFYDIFKLDDDHTKRYLHIICQRLVSLEDEFGEPIGRLDKFMKESLLPPAPKDEIPDCNQQ